MKSSKSHVHNQHNELVTVFLQSEDTKQNKRCCGSILVIKSDGADSCSVCGCMMAYVRVGGDLAEQGSILGIFGMKMLNLLGHIASCENMSYLQCGFK